MYQLLTKLGLDCRKLYQGKNEECSVYCDFLAKQYVRAGFKISGGIQSKSYDKVCHDRKQGLHSWSSVKALVRDLHNKRAFGSDGRIMVSFGFRVYGVMYYEV
jgi:hypothetical protein